MSSVELTKDFEGPLDLLLYLIKKQEVDIYEVNLTALATQRFAQ